MNNKYRIYKFWSVKYSVTYTPLVIRNPNFRRGKQIFLTLKEKLTLQIRNLRTGETLIFFLKGWLASTFFHVLLHSIARMACQKLMLEISILIFRARRAVSAPDSWLGQKIKIAMDQEIKFFAFLNNFPRGSGGSPEGPRGCRGAFSARKRSSGP